MKPGKTSIYLSERVANLLEEHGPSSDGSRNLSEKLGYIVPAWDKILRDEKRRWAALLTREEWLVCQSCTISHSFAMEDGGPLEMDLSDAVLACVEDTLDTELEMEDAPRWRESTIAKLRGASAAAQLALVWMLLRERRRTA